MACRKEIYNLPINAIISHDVPVPVTGHKILMSPSGNGFYVIGGWHPDQKDPFDNDPENFDLGYVRQIWKYNLSRKSWTKLRSTNPPMGMASHSCCWLNNSQFLLYGGSLSTKSILGNSNQCYSYDVETERWDSIMTYGDHCPEICGHWFGSAATKFDAHFFTATGIQNNTAYDEMAIHTLDLNTMSWSYLKDRTNSGGRPLFRVRHDIVYYQNKIFVIAGAHSFQGVCRDLYTVPCFDIRSNQWTILPTSPKYGRSFPFPRHCQACVQRDNNVSMFGGFWSDGVAFCVLNDAWLFDVENLTWSCLPTMPQRLWFHAADLAPDGRTAYLYGGCTDVFYGALRTNDTYTFDLDSNQPERLETISWRSVQKYTDNFTFTKANVKQSYKDVKTKWWTDTLKLTPSFASKITW